MDLWLKPVTPLMVTVLAVQQTDLVYKNKKTQIRYTDKAEQWELALQEAVGSCATAALRAWCPHLSQGAVPFLSLLTPSSCCSFGEGGGVGV